MDDKSKERLAQAEKVLEELMAKHERHEGKSLELEERFPGQRFRYMRGKTTFHDSFQQEPSNIALDSLGKLLKPQEYKGVQLSLDEMRQLNSQAELICHLIEQNGACPQTLESIVFMFTEFAQKQAEKALAEQETEFNKIRRHYDTKIQQQHFATQQVRQSYESLRDMLSLFLSKTLREYEETGKLLDSPTGGKALKTLSQAVLEDME